MRVGGRAGGEEGRPSEGQGALPPAPRHTAREACLPPPDGTGPAVGVSAHRAVGHSRAVS